MTPDNLIILIAGVVLTTLAVALFLLSSIYGLKHGKWLPFVTITSLWLLAMLIYAFSEFRDLEGSTRPRIGATHSTGESLEASLQWPIATGNSDPGYQLSFAFHASAKYRDPSINGSTFVRLPKS